MIYEVEVSEQADSDLRGIFEYIAFERRISILPLQVRRAPGGG